MSDSTVPPPPPLSAGQEKSSPLAALTQRDNLLSALKWGALIALVYYVVNVLLVLLSNVVSEAGLFAIVPACLEIFVYGFSVYAAGYQPANERGHISVGLAGAIIMLVIAEILGKIYQPTVSVASNSNTSNGVTTPAIFIVSALLYLAVTLLIGWAGGNMGAKNHAKRAAMGEAGKTR